MLTSSDRFGQWLRARGLLLIPEEIETPEILRDLDELKDGAALRVPLADLGNTKENVRSALNRATRKSNREVATATDEIFLYVWNVAKPEPSKGTPASVPGKPSRVARQG